LNMRSITTFQSEPSSGRNCN